VRVTANYLRRLIAIELERTLSEGRLLFEEEKDAEEEGAADDLFGDDAGDDTGDDAGDEGGDAKVAKQGDAAGDDEDTEEEEPAEGEEPEEEKEEEEEPPKPTGPTGFEFDEEINTALAGFEKRALDVAAAKNEGRTLSMARFLFEAEEEEIALDVATFADDTARLISNYDTLIDMEQAIYTKAVDFVADKYGDEAAEQLRDILSLRYDLEFDEQNDPEGDEEEFYAVGATGGGGGAA
jgi:hypothetical protein